MKKRVLAVLLAFCLILTGLSQGTVFASGSESEESSTSTDHSNYTALTAASGGTLAEGLYYLSSDITLSSNLTITGNVTIDLNGHTLKSSASGEYITIESGGNLTIKDCQASEITEVEEDSLPSSVYSDTDEDDTKEFTASTVKNTDSNSTATGTFTTYFSATITNEITGETTTTYYSYTSGAIDGGSPESSNSKRAVYVKSGGTFTLLSGTITGFYKTGSSVDTASSNGSAVYCQGTFSMSGGAISGNKIYDGYGGAVSVNSGTFSMLGGVLSGNTAEKANSNNTGKGGALYVYGTATDATSAGDGTANITGGYITNNSSQRSGGAIYVDNAKLVIGTQDSSDHNAVVISNNTGSTGGTEDGGGAIYINGNESRTGVAQLYLYSGYITNNLSYKAYAGGIAAGDSQSYIYMYGGAITGNTAQKKSDSDTKKGGGVGIIGGTMTMSGGYISYNTASDRGGGVCVGNGGTSNPGFFTMSGGYITNNVASDTGGGGIWIDGATVSITGGTITGNSAATYGGGIYVNIKSNTGSLSVTGGVVANNTATTAAADIYAESGTSLTLNTPSSSSAVNTDTIYTGDSYNLKIDNWYEDKADTTTTDDDGNTTTTTNRYNGASLITNTVSATGSALSSAVYAIAAHGTVYTLTYDGNAIGTNDKVSSVPDMEYYTLGSTATLSTDSPTYTTTNGSNVTFLGWTTTKNTKIYSSSDSVTTVTEQTITSNTTVYAAWQYGTNYTLTIKDTVAGHTYYIYQILTGDVGDDLKDGEGTLSNIGTGSSIDDEEAPTTEDVLSSLKDDNGNYLTGEDLGNAAYTLVDTDAYVRMVEGNGGDITISNLAGGYYIVVDTWSSDYDDDEYTYTVLSRNVVAVVGDTTVSLKTVTPTITKTITDTDANAAIDDADTVDTAAIGDTINYKISGSVPDTTGYTTYQYIVHDTLSAGLTLKATSFKIKIGSSTLTIKIVDQIKNKTYSTNDGSTYTEVTDTSSDTTSYAATVTITQNTEDGTTSFEITGLDLTKYNYGDVIVITYRAKVNENAEIGTDPNTNTAYLEYSNEPNNSSEEDNNSEDTNNTGHTTNVYTYTYVTGLSVIKVDDEGDRLTGATFTLTGDNLTQLVVTVNSTYTEVTDSTSTSDGTVYYYKLTDGSYTTTAPSTEEGADNSAYADTNTKYTVTTTTEVQTAQTETSSETDESETSETTVSATVGADGYLTFTGLNAGTYTLSETAPDGYTDMTPITFTVRASYTYSETSGTYVFAWSSDADTVTYDETSGTFVVTVENLAKAKLTATGGIGTMIFYVVGGLLIVTSASLLAMKKRKRRG